MDYTLDSIVREVIIDKLDDDEFDTEIVKRFINATQRNIFNQFELPFQEKIFAGSVPQGEALFRLPSDVALVQSFVLTAPDGEQREMSARYIAFRDFNKLFPAPMAAQVGDLSQWTLYGDNIMLSSPTDKEYTLTLFYIKKPTALRDGTDVPEIPEEFRELLVLGAFKRIQERNEDYDQAAVIGQQYDDALNMLVSRYGFRQSNGPIKMKNQQNSSGSSSPLVRKSY